jgi:TPP-dependent pyruvate/acetoin dehydrogenase alpha subunit
VHESLNLAQMLKSPTIFVVENNLFASHMHISLRQPMDSTARFAQANGMPSAVIDGNDVLEVQRVANEFITRAREGGGPAFIEAITFRWFGHVDWREDIDVGVNRSTEDLEDWRARDPIARLSKALIAAGDWSVDQELALNENISLQIEKDWEQAMNDPYPANSALLERVYA